MALPERKPDEDELLDPTAAVRAYRKERARRRAREEREWERRLARLRFWLVVVAMIGAIIGLSIVAWQEIQHLFGL
jgi:hypothetical protein